MPPWTYDSEERRKLRGLAPKQPSEAMAELVAAVKSVKVDGYEPRIVVAKPDYLRVEYRVERGVLAMADDVEFFFPGGDLSRVEYRSAARAALPWADGSEISRRRIRALRGELQKQGWRSVGF